MGWLGWLLGKGNRNSQIDLSAIQSSVPKWSPPKGHLHYLAYVDPIKAAKKAGKLEEAKRLAILAIESTENESRTTGYGVAPWYYEQAAIICRKAGDRAGELAILERYAQQKHAAGVGPAKLADRLSKLKSKGV